jgi:protein TonB
VWLVLSLALHAGLVIGARLVIDGATPPVLFIDLVHGLFETDDGATAGRSGRGDGVPAGPRAATPADRVASVKWKSPRPSAEAASREPTRSVAAPAAPVPEMPRPVMTPVSPPAPAVETSTPLPEPVRPAPEPARAPSEPLLVTPEPAPPSPRATDGGASSAVTGSRGDPTSQGAGVISSGESGERAARGTGGSVGGGRSVADGGGGRGQGLGARDGSALALAIPGEGGGDGVADAMYQALHRRLKEALAYPPGARRRRLAGTVEVVLDIEPSGKITDVVLAKSSSHEVLDEAALAAVRKVGRVPFPSNVRPQRLRVRVPLVFNLP